MGAAHLRVPVWRTRGAGPSHTGPGCRHARTPTEAPGIRSLAAGSGPEASPAAAGELHPLSFSQADGVGETCTTLFCSWPALATWVLSVLPCLLVLGVPSAHICQNRAGEACSAAAGQADWPGADRAGAGPACWPGQWGWGAVRTWQGSASLAVDFGEGGEGIRMGTGAVPASWRAQHCGTHEQAKVFPSGKHISQWMGWRAAADQGPPAGKAEVQRGRGPGGDSGTRLGDKAGLRIKSKTLAAVS